MQDQNCSNASPVKTDKVSINTKKQCIENDFLDVTALIRSIQRVEGNFDCYSKAKEYCDQSDCCWRPYCLERNQLFNETET
jgi:hypothetical protein